MFYLILICILISAFFEGKSYYRQCKKILRLRDSKAVSLKAYRDKLMKYLIAMLGLTLAKNWAGLTLEIMAFLMCVVTYIIIRRYR